MTSELVALCFDAQDPEGLARFWSGVLGWATTEDDDSVVLIPTDDTGYRLRSA